MWFDTVKRIRSMDLQAKVLLILALVIFPISILLGLVQARVLEPVLTEEVHQVAISFAQNLAGQIETHRWLQKPKPNVPIEDKIQQMMYTQPSILRVDVIQKKPDAPGLFYVASSVEDAELLSPPFDQLNDNVVSEITKEEGIPVWSIIFPVASGGTVANIHILASLRFISAVHSTTLKINLVGALVSTILLILVLSFFLRRAIENEKQLKVAQKSNEVLSEKLQEIQQELIHTEKLAVMGQLTASFAHEIGTPLNAIGGHMQLLDMDLVKAVPEDALRPLASRMGIITGQIKKIEDIVKGFLATTKKPIPQQRSLVTTRELIERILALVLPTLQRHQISFGQDFRASKDWVEVVPLEIEQVVLNLVNNAIDSMKGGGGAHAPNALWIRTLNDSEGQTVTIEIQDTGHGISAENLKQIFKPFFTTKSAGEGHGLGLSICQQIIRSYGGDILVNSVLNKGTTIKVELPVKMKVGRA